MTAGLLGLSIAGIAAALSLILIGIAAVVIIIRLTPARHVSHLRIILAAILIISLLGLLLVPGVLQPIPELLSPAANQSERPTGGPIVTVYVTTSVKPAETPLDQLVAVSPLFSVIISAAGLVVSLRRPASKG